MAPGLFGLRLGAAIALVAHLTGCALFDLEGERDRLLDQATRRGWQIEAVRTRPFTLFTATRFAAPGAALVVYFEGDGRAWIDPNTPSNDPTPERPVALRLALADSAANVAYIARPCQYLDLARFSPCTVRFWTTQRLAPSVIESLSAAIDRAKRRSGSSQVELIGYSGGGAAAVLVAARRDDVVRLVTVAANLDLRLWARLAEVYPLEGSLDPADEAQRTAGIPQIHLAGEEDEIVPPAVIRSFVARAGLGEAALREVPGIDHACCWHRDWGARISRIRREIPAKTPGS